jgi:hypothetical protein
LVPRKKRRLEGCSGADGARRRRRGRFVQSGEGEGIKDAISCDDVRRWKKWRIVRLGFGTARQKTVLLNDGRIQNPSDPFGIVPLSNFVLRGFGFVHHSIAILYHEVPNPYLTIRNFLIAVRREERGAQAAPPRGRSGGGDARR